MRHPNRCETEAARNDVADAAQASRSFVFWRIIPNPLGPLLKPWSDSWLVPVRCPGPMHKVLFWKESSDSDEVKVEDMTTAGGRESMAGTVGCLALSLRLS